MEIHPIPEMPYIGDGAEKLYALNIEFTDGTKLEIAQRKAGAS